MTTSRPSRQRHYPYERGLGRAQRRAAAQELLRGYLREVSGALREYGFEVIRTHLGHSHDLGELGDDLPGGLRDDLDALLTVTPADPARHELPPVLALSWAEDTGWAVSHQRIQNSATPWRYLHIALVPDPATVARFLAVVAEDEDGEVGMLYPARFRFRGQPLQPVLDELARQANDHREDHRDREGLQQEVE